MTVYPQGRQKGLLDPENYSKRLSMPWSVPMSKSTITILRTNSGKS